MMIAFVQRRDTVILVQLATIPRIANAIPIVIDYPAILKQQTEHVDLCIISDHSLCAQHETKLPLCHPCVELSLPIPDPDLLS